MKSIGTLARHVFREQMRSRAYLSLLLFGGALIYASLLAGVLAVDEEPRVLLDMGLGLMELTVLVSAVYGAATAILQEMDSKTIYLILSRPIAKWQYLLGRFAGLLLTSFFALAAMSALHLVLLLAVGWKGSWAYPALVAFIFLKVSVIAALAAFFSLFSTSVISAVSFTGFLWLLGHFLPELEKVIRHSDKARALLLQPTLYLIPNLQLFNLRDHFDAPGLLASASTYTLPLGYAFCYSAVCLGMAAFLFDRREF